MRRLLVTWNSLKMALNELRVNKLRTFLSLFGVTIGIFCIISVLAVVQSLEQYIQNGLKSLGSNTVFIQKWPWNGGSDFPRWKYLKRPDPNYNELRQVKERSHYAAAATFVLASQTTLSYQNDLLQNVSWYGVTEDFNAIQDVTILSGRYLSAAEFQQGSNVVIMGHDNAEKLFGQAESAVGKEIEIAGRKAHIVGVTKKKGQSFIGAGWDFDNLALVPFNFCRQLVNERNSGRWMMVKGKAGIEVQNLKDELKGVMRGIRKLQPQEEDNFALNDITSGSQQLEDLFGKVNLGGLIIGGFSLIVGLFGIANIMFVTVRERTSQIGLKKAIGARRSTILTEFLMESSFLCLIGGLVGLLLVFGITLALGGILPFPVFISLKIIALAIAISITVGLLAGIIPAWNAAKMDPVVAIRSK